MTTDKALQLQGRPRGNLVRAFAALALSPVLFASIGYADVKSDLGIREGFYSATESDLSVCDDSDIAWVGTKKPILKIGDQLRFANFNTGTVQDVQPYYPDECRYEFTTTTQAGRLTEIKKEICNWGHSEQESVLRVEDNKIHYTVSRVSTNEKQSPSFKSECVFVLKKAKSRK